MHARLLAGLLALLTVPTLAQTNSSVADPYAWLNATNLPSPQVLVEAALKNLPKSINQKQDWLKRMHRAAWYPSLELQYSIGEAVYRPYTTVNREIVTSGSEQSSERSSGSDRSSSVSIDNGSNVNGPSSGQGVQVDQSSSSGRRSTSTSFTQTEKYGPDSYAKSERTRWVNDYGVFLTWDLSRLIFQRDEIAVASAEIDKEQFRQDIRLQVIQTYYELKETLLLLQNDAYSNSLPQRIRKERVAYLLDTLSAGALSGSAGQKMP